jgi:hypothetical protein
VASEHELLSQKFGKAMLSFKTGLGGVIIKAALGQILGDASFITDAIVDSIAESTFIKAATEGEKVVLGTAKDIANKPTNMQRITLTDKNIYLYYVKGRGKSKQQKLIILPLKYAKDVRTEGILIKNVLIKFEIPQREKEEWKTLYFDLALRVFLPDIWMSTIKCAISEPLLESTEEKVLGCIDIAKTAGRYGLHFTKNRVIIANSHISHVWRALTFLSMVVGGFFFAIGFFTPLIYGTRNLIIFQFQVAAVVGLVFAVFPLIIFATAENWKYRKLLKYGPNDLLANDKKNFDIPYSDIAQVELKKVRLGFRTKIKILTKSESHEFFILNTSLLNYHMSLVRWVLPESKLILPEVKEKKLPKELQ